MSKRVIVPLAKDQVYVSKEDETRLKQRRTLTVLSTELLPNSRVDVVSENDRTGTKRRITVKLSRLQSSAYRLEETKAPAQPALA